MNAAPATAARYTATNATFKSVFAAVVAGDTIALSGSFGAISLANRSFATPVTIDARGAQFDAPMSIKFVSGLSFLGGQFGSTTAAWQDAWSIRVEDSSKVSFKALKMISAGAGQARGITFQRSQDISLTNSSFSGFRVAGGVNTVDRGVISRNTVTGSTSDGFNFVNNHFITATSNICSGGVPSEGAHPDCIQMWSLAGMPVQSDIRLLNNKAYGYTQGFTSFDPERGGGLRIEMSGNYVETMYPNGLACYACVDSRFTGNTLVTMPGADHQTRIAIVGGSNNVIKDNSIGPRPLAGFAAFDADMLASGVPEPVVWAQLVAGFALVGGLLRRRQLVGAASR